MIALPSSSSFPSTNQSKTQSAADKAKKEVDKQKAKGTWRDL